MNKIINDEDVLSFISPDDLWVYDKFILSKKLGYYCGPSGTVPLPGRYIVRPCVNFRMMSAGARISLLEDDRDKDLVPPGYFWCETFKGRHLSFDYQFGKQVLAVEGFRNSYRLDRFSEWRKVNDTYKLPDLLKPLTEKYEWLNIEVIGDKIIEVHLRYNDDFVGHTSSTIIPVWKDDSELTKKNNFHFNPCGDRLGFLLL